jgi:hypothetical protein
VHAGRGYNLFPANEEGRLQTVDAFANNGEGNGKGNGKGNVVEQILRAM